MYPVLSCLALSPIIIFYHLLICNIIRNRDISIKAMFTSFLLFFISVFVYLNFYLDIDISPYIFICVFSTSFSICLIYMECFSMVCRGFSMRIITDIHKNNGLRVEEIISGYSDGRGIEWLLKKRIDGLVKFGFLIQNNNKLLVKSLTIVSIIKLSEIYKDLLKIGKGGV